MSSPSTKQFSKFTLRHCKDYSSHLNTLGKLTHRKIPDESIPFETKVQLANHLETAVESALLSEGDQNQVLIYWLWTVHRALLQNYQGTIAQTSNIRQKMKTRCSNLPCLPGWNRLASVQPQEIESWLFAIFNEWLALSIQFTSSEALEALLTVLGDWNPQKEPKEEEFLSFLMMIMSTRSTDAPCPATNAGASPQGCGLQPISALPSEDLYRMLTGASRKNIGKFCSSIWFRPEENGPCFSLNLDEINPDTAVRHMFFHPSGKPRCSVTVTQGAENGASPMELKEKLLRENMALLLQNRWAPETQKRKFPNSNTP